jgi:hypothetical protein
MTRYRSCAILAVLLVACVTVRVQADPLRLALGCSQAPEVTFRFTIQNVSAASSTVVIGAIFGNPKIYLPYRLELTVKRAGVSDTILTYVRPSPTRIGGRVDPWLIFLPSDASYSASVPARNFRLRPDQAMKPFSVPELEAVLVDRPADIQLRLTTREMGESTPAFRVSASSSSGWERLHPI